jgi:DNA mismatch repair protein MutS
MATLTPMLQQYHRAKGEHPHAIVLFRLGDFYEMFYEDARVASNLLGLALTARGRGTQNEAPMCGIPYHAAEGYIAKLVRAGHRVALCDQVEDSSKAKGLVRREVTRVVSPGTVTDPGLLEEGRNVYLTSVCRDGQEVGVAYGDLSTGELRIAQAPLEQAREALALQFASFRPTEILAPEEADLSDHLPRPEDGESGLSITRAPAWTFGREAAMETLTRHFETAGLEGFGCAHLHAGIRAAGALLRHLAETQKSSLDHFTRMRPYTSADHLVLDETTLRTLEISASLRDGRREGTLLQVLDRTLTPMGSRLLRAWLLSPSTDLEEIRTRHDAVEELLRHRLELDECRAVLRGIKDIERILGRLALGTATARDLVALRDSLAVLPDLGEVIGRLDPERLRPGEGIDDSLGDLEQLIREAIADEPAGDLHDGGIVRDGYNEQVDDLRSVSRDGRAYLANLEAREKDRTGISSLKVRYNKVFGYYIEVTKPNLDSVPEDYERRQTLVGAERFITPELKTYEEKVLTAQERIGSLEYEIFLEVRGRVASSASRVRRAAESVACLDALAAFAETASSERYVRPRMAESGPLVLREGRHPVVERATIDPFVPNSTQVGGEGPRILILTGPNMGGKSTYLRQVALITLMAHAGSFVPASEARIPVVDRIFSRVGASDNLASGQSTFMVEMTETANILNNATSRSLVLLDEVGRGTATFDGLSLAWAIVEHLHGGTEPAPMTIFATHYHEMTDIALTLHGVRNLTMAVQETPRGVVFLRRVEEGSSSRSYGIQVAKLAGLPKEVLERAREILANLESNEVGRDGMPRLARHRDAGAVPVAQLNLFGRTGGDAADEIAEELRGIDPNAVTPLDALQILARLRRKLGD